MFWSTVYVLYNTGKINHEGPHFPTYYGARSATTPDKIFTNKKAYFNLHAAPGPDSSSDHIVVMVKIASGPIKVEIRERKSVKNTDWENYRRDLERLELDPLEGKNTEEIDRALEKVTEAIKEAIDRRVPKIRSRTLPHPKIDEETKNMMKEAEMLKMLMAMKVNYAINRRKLIALRELIREREREREGKLKGVNKI